MIIAISVDAWHFGRKRHGVSEIRSHRGKDRKGRKSVEEKLFFGRPHEKNHVVSFTCTTLSDYGLLQKIPMTVARCGTVMKGMLRLPVKIFNAMNGKDAVQGFNQVEKGFCEPGKGKSPKEVQECLQLHKAEEKAGIRSSRDYHVSKHPSLSKLHTMHSKKSDTPVKHQNGGLSKRSVAASAGSHSATMVIKLVKKTLQSKSLRKFAKKIVTGFGIFFVHFLSQGSKELSGHHKVRAHKV